MEYIFIQHGYSKPDYRPHLVLQPASGRDLQKIYPAGKKQTLVFNLERRFCTGWHDLEAGQSYPCPDGAALPAQFSQCRRCQNKTGFNPAFYHAASVSPQQQKRNANPHFLYLAHFAPGVVKVGITWAERGLARLLDQGARSALVLKTYPTALQARQYEAKVAALPGISETLKASLKHKLLKYPYDAQAAAAELLLARQRAAELIGLTPEDNRPEHLDSYYFRQFEPQNFVTVDQPQISGLCAGLVGSILIHSQNGMFYGLGLSKLPGYVLRIEDEETENSVQPQQASLF